MEITEKWLGDIAGWAVMKAARGLVAAGRVSAAGREGDLIRGTMGAGKNLQRCGLRIRSKTDAENLCTCPVARRSGQICEHSVAVALALLGGGANAGKPEARSRETIPPASSADLKDSPPAVGEVAGEFAVFLPDAILKPAAPGAGRRGFACFLQFTPANGNAARHESSPLAGWLSRMRLAPASMPLHLPEDAMDGFLESLAGHPRVVVGRPGQTGAPRLQVAVEAGLPMLVIRGHEGQDGSTEAELSWPDGDQGRVIARDERRWWIFHQPAHILCPIQIPQKPEIKEVLTSYLTTDGKTGLRRSWAWLARCLPRLQDVFQVEFSGPVASRFRLVSANAKPGIRIAGSLQRLEAELKMRFQGLEWSVGNSDLESFPLQDEKDAMLFYHRDVESENQWERLLQRFGFRLDTSIQRWILSGLQEILHFYGSRLPQLEALVTVEATDSWRRATSGLLRIAPDLGGLEASSGEESGGSGVDWLDCTLQYRAADGFNISRAETLRLIRTGNPTVKGPGGRIYVLDGDACEEFEEALQDIDTRQTTDGLRVRREHQSFFMPFSQRLKLASSNEQAPDLAAVRNQLGDLGTVLRDYQIEGAAWVAQRLRRGQGALLADDMGLGKTLQSLAVLRLRPGGEGPSLVLCPKTLVSNWESEIRKFAPGLRVRVVQGQSQDRSKQLRNFQDHDVRITSYSLLFRDIEYYRNFEFSHLILDEASVLRNPDTETSSAVRQLRARGRLALTGTPIENGVRDLWSIFEILAPGYLGTRKHFQERFEKPLQVATSAAPASGDSSPVNPAAGPLARLRRLARPFVLRRTKSEVLRELPEKIEQILWCDLSAAQNETYRRLLEEGREEIRLARRRQGSGSARHTMFTVLLRLRQACCDLRLLGLPAERLRGARQDDLSGKWSMLQTNLLESVESGHKCLIFSQFTSYLKLAKEWLEQESIDCAYLDGSTRERGAVIEHFQRNSDCRVFLISLKAGGYGLNLTQADQVYLLDPWWNPAVEAQAIDRAHRFGQQRAVNAYRLITRGTVEERILQLQQRKRGWIAGAIEESGSDSDPWAGAGAGLTEGELLELLE